MKTTLLLCALTTAAFAGSPVLKPVTAESLLKLQKSSPMAEMQQPQPAELAASRPEEQSILKSSVILHDGTNWTLVPKGAVVFIPTPLKSRADAKPVGNLLSWTDFLIKNRSWITTTDISFDQAAGNQPIPAERAIFWAQQDKIVVAVHQSGPISVRIAAESRTLTQR